MSDECPSCSNVQSAAWCDYVCRCITQFCGSDKRGTLGNHCYLCITPGKGLSYLNTILHMCHCRIITDSEERTKYQFDIYWCHSINKCEKLQELKPKQTVTITSCDIELFKYKICKRHQICAANLTVQLVCL